MNWRGKAGVREPKSRLFQPGKASNDNGQSRKGQSRAWVSDICKGDSAEFGGSLWVGEGMGGSQWETVTLNPDTMCD